MGDHPDNQDNSPSHEAAGESSPTSSLQIGSVLAGRYRILSRLGDGAMGSVYLAEHLKIGRKDAIKVLRDSLAGDAESMARFVRGARGVSRIRHENVCTIYDFSDTAEGVQFLAMEYIPGLTLREVLTQQGTVPLERALGITVQAAGALQAAHDAGIVHRDLKPANIMLMTRRDGSDLVKVVDFDIAKAEDDTSESEVTRFGFVVGTPEYMSPEQLTGESLDGRSDVYSLALVVYRMLTGLLPFRVENTREMLVSRLTQDPMTLAQLAPGSSFPPSLQIALDAALKRNPKERTPSAAAFAKAMTEALSGFAPASGPTPARQPVDAASSFGTDIPATRVADGALLRDVIQSPTGSRTGRRVLFAGLAVAALALVTTITALALSNADEGDSGAGAQPEDSANQQVMATDSPDVVLYSNTAETNPRDSIRRPPPVDPQRPPPADPPPVSNNTRLAELDSLIRRQRGTLLRLPLPADSDQRSAQRGSLAAIRDSATFVWMQSTSQDQKALAAFVVGSALYRLEQLTEAREWAQRAVDLCTANCRAYEQLLQIFPARQ